MPTRILSTLVLVLCAGMAQAMPMLSTDGATGLMVGDKTYNVEFVDGTCIDLFGGCDEDSDFTFMSEADATVASGVLLALIEATEDPDIDADPALMNGCSNSSFCFIMTPLWSGYWRCFDKRREQH